MSDQAFHVLSTIVAWLALGVLVIALFADWFVQRFRKRRRCPRCWYPMHGTPGMVCSECGYAAKRERKLFKARRRWRLVWLALLMFTGSYALRVTPGVKDRGWVAAVPTTALIAALPWLEPLDDAWKYRDEPEPPVTVRNRLAAELLEHRGRAATLWNWQERWLVEQCLAGDESRVPPSWEWNRWYGELLNALTPLADRDEQRWFERADALVDLEVKTREIWPVGEDIYADLRIRRWNDWLDHRVHAQPVSPGAIAFDDYVHSVMTRVNYGIGWRDNLTRVGRSNAPREGLDYEIVVLGNAGDYENEAWMRKRLYRLHIPVRLTDDLRELGMEAVDTIQFTEAMRAVLNPTLTHSRYGYSLDLWNVHNEGSAAAKSLLGVTFGVEYEIRQDDAVVCTGTSWSEVMWLADDFWGMHPSGRVKCEFSSAAEFDEGHEWSVTLKGELVPALRNLDCNRYWAGEITLPVEVVNR